MDGRCCRFCHAPLVPKLVRPNGYESPAIFARRKHCDRACMARGMQKEHPTRSAYLVRARPFLKSACEQCGATDRRLTIHHKDLNWANNAPENLATLCSSCHTSLHHSRGDIVARGSAKLCTLCGRIQRRSVCHTCRTMVRRAKRLGVSLTQYLSSLRCRTAWTASAPAATAPSPPRSPSLSAPSPLD